MLKNPASKVSRAFVYLFVSAFVVFGWAAAIPNAHADDAKAGGDLLAQQQGPQLSPHVQQSPQQQQQAQQPQGPQNPQNPQDPSELYESDTVSSGLESTRNSMSGRNTGLVGGNGSRFVRVGSASNPRRLSINEYDLDITSGSGDAGKNLGGTLRYRGQVAWTHADLSKERTCGFYGGIAGQVDGSAHFNRAGENKLAANIGPEAGFLCRTRDVLIQLGPAAALGYAKASEDPNLELGHGTDDNVVHVGGRARVATRGKFLFSADAFRSVRNRTVSPDSLDSRYGSVNLQVRDLYGGAVFTGSLKGFEVASESDPAKDVRGYSASAMIGKEF